ncbi:MAG: hypothetical protein R3C45_15175 [Phycisphaerales bacterium]
MIRCGWGGFLRGRLSLIHDRHHFAQALDRPLLDTQPLQGRADHRRAAGLCPQRAPVGVDVRGGVVRHMVEAVRHAPGAPGEVPAPDGLFRLRLGGDLPLGLAPTAPLSVATGRVALWVVPTSAADRAGLAG